MEQNDDLWIVMKQKVKDRRDKVGRRDEESKKLSQIWSQPLILAVVPSPIRYKLIEALRRLTEKHRDDPAHVLNLLERAVVTRLRKRKSGSRLDRTLMASDIDKARAGDFDGMPNISDTDLQELGVMREPNRHGLIDNPATSSMTAQSSPLSLLSLTHSSTPAITIQPLIGSAGERSSRVILRDSANATHTSDGTLTPLDSPSLASSETQKSKASSGVSTSGLGNHVESQLPNPEAATNGSKTASRSIDKQNNRGAVPLKTRSRKRRRVDSTFQGLARRREAAATPSDIEELNLSTQMTEQLLTGEKGRHIRCRCLLIDWKVLAQINSWRKHTLSEAIGLLVSVIDADSAPGAQVCHAHWCRVASHLGMHTNIDDRPMNSFELAPRLRKVHEERENLDALRTQGPTRY